ncbi:MAG TPA: hypothetical protein VHA78_01580 [Candidatus Peribacteraceae bacterium]|nr:hypothetical protein [Candidatus Peribacteraceae bacterium]
MTDRTFNILRFALLALLILWGGFTYLEYVGVPVHEAVLLGDTQQQQIQQNCPGGGLCAGWQAMIPTVTHTIARAAPFLWYVIISAIAFVVVLTMGFLKTGKWTFSFTLTPLKLIIGFLVCLWLLFTTLGQGSIPGTNQPYRDVIQPTSQVYQGADPQTLEVLAQDYDTLKSRGCLTVLPGVTAGGAEVSQMSQGCMQISFVTRVFTEFIAILYLIFVLLSFGRLWYRLFRLPERHPLLEMLFSLGLGICSTIVILWVLAVAGIYTQTVGWILVILLPLIAWKDSLYWITSLTQKKWTYEGAWYGGALLLGWLLLSYLVFNFLTVVRPFPIGWDDLGVYMNDPRLMVSYGHFIPRLEAFQWEYITSFGFLLFGYDSPFGATTSMLINWMAGLFAAMSVYIFGRTFFGRAQGFISALAFYTLPMIGHFSFADMKVDNAVFTLGTMSLIAVFVGLFRLHHERQESEDAAEEKSPYHWKWMVLAGVFAGFGFAMKPTTIMTIMSLNAVIGGVLLHGAGFLGVAMLVMGVFSQQKLFNMEDISRWLTGDPHAYSQSVATAIFAVLGILIIAVAAYRRPTFIKRSVLGIIIFSATFLVTLVPWVMHNNILAGNTVPHLLLSAPNTYAPTFVIDKKQVLTETGSNIRALPESLAVNASAPACTNLDAKSEELDRYWGFAQGWSHYLGLPWRSVMNSDSVGYYVTTTFALLLFPLLLLLPFFWSKEGKWLRYLTWATTFLIIQWIFFANGVPWYGIGMFLGLAVMLEAFVNRAPDATNRTVASVILFLSFIIVFANRFWQFEQQGNLYSYAFGAVSAEAMQERTIPHYQDIANVVEQRAQDLPQMPYVYRVGTFIPYFIPKNLQIIPNADNQLLFFSCLNQDGNHQLTLKRLESLGFNSIIFDTNTATIEQNPNGPLHQSVQNFLDFLNDPSLHLQVVVNDPGGGIVFVLLPQTLPASGSGTVK